MAQAHLPLRAQSSATPLANKEKKAIWQAFLALIGRARSDSGLETWAYLETKQRPEERALAERVLYLRHSSGRFV